ncbi:MAG: type I methionyl aminopeptidase [Acidobacteriota bacterium]|nr:type I methionyl aminopeptidase [Acidobacteriota bacterium]
MSIGSDVDWAGMRSAGRLVRLTLDTLAREVRSGITTGELDRIAAGLIRARGGRSAPADTYGFPGTVLISVNDEIVHGVPGGRRIARGDIVSLDVTLEKDGYIADAARTVAVDGADDAACRLIACAEAAFAEGLAAARVGNRVNEIGRAVSRAVRARGFTVVRGLCGHGVGRTIHEPPQVPNDYDPRQRDVLTDGLVIAIEPMVSAGSARTRTATDGWTIHTSDGSRAAHYEHTVVVTSGGPVVLTAA